MLQHCSLRTFGAMRCPPPAADPFSNVPPLSSLVPLRTSANTSPILANSRNSTHRRFPLDLEATEHRIPQRGCCAGGFSRSIAMGTEPTITYLGWAPPRVHVTRKEPRATTGTHALRKRELSCSLRRTRRYQKPSIAGRTSALRCTRCCAALEGPMPNARHSTTAAVRARRRTDVATAKDAAATRIATMRRRTRSSTQHVCCTPLARPVLLNLRPRPGAGHRSAHRLGGRLPCTWRATMCRSARSRRRLRSGTSSGKLSALSTSKHV